MSTCEIVRRAEDLPPGSPADVFVVVDVLRFSTTTAAALAAGARGVRPFEDAGEARAFGREADGAVLIGERDGERLPGFDLDNSPSAVEEADLAGRPVAIVTTNGTRTIARIREARGAGGGPGGRIWVGSTVNARAVAAGLRRRGGDACLVAAGSRGRVADEDLGGAELIRDRREGREVADEAAERYRARIRRSRWARRLVGLGRGDDVERALRFDALDVVPVLCDDGAIVRLEEL